MLRLFSGTNNIRLSSQVAKLLKIPLSQSEVVHFEDSEVRIRLIDDVKNQTCVIIQPTSNPADSSFMELCFFADAMRRAEAKKIIAVIPYLGYARQNIQHRPGEAVSINVIIRFLETVGIDEVVAFDLHDEATQGIFSIPFTHLSGLGALAQAVKEYLGKKMIVVPKMSSEGIIPSLIR